MDQQQKERFLENLNHVQNLIRQYEELRNIPNVNPFVILSNNFFVLEFKIGEDEHGTHLGI
jgi:hypothetical protein